MNATYSTTVIEPDFIDELKKELPELPAEKKERYIDDYKMSEAEALLISSDPELAQYFDKVVEISGDHINATKFVSNILIGWLKKHGEELSECKITAESLGKLVKLVKDGKISMSSAKSDVFEEMFEHGKDPEKIISDMGLEMMSDASELEEICKKIVSENQQSVEDYKQGKQNAFFFLVGQVMKATKGQADGKMVTDILKKLVNS